MKTHQTDRDEENHLRKPSEDISDIKNVNQRYDDDYGIRGKAFPNGTFLCTREDSHKTPIMKLKNIFDEERLWRDENRYNIFLIETSCNPKPTYRSWCSVESMAQNNPKATVWFVMTSPVIHLQDGLAQDLGDKYSNLQYVTVDLDRVFNGTPLEELYKSKAWHENTAWPAANLSNMIRKALIWHTGGFYSDTDAICIAPLTSLRNVIGMATINLVNGAAFHFDRHHPMLWHFMEYLNKNFDPFTWGKNGPQTVSAVLRDVCGFQDLRQGIECQGIKILSAQAFNPIPPQGSKVLFQVLKEDLRKNHKYNPQALGLLKKEIESYQPHKL
ncbi:hypothetical protein SK128_014032 [Halocaridina rubra]|uniref:Alpha 1,4-glycosyltransferase domain-containing protein n=1 Tax=Halocaridina rubra TaxID=373956 RepID=A0AAN8X107_HALRR